MGNRRIFRNYTATKRDEGFVLVSALMVIFLVVTIVLTVTLVTASDLRASAKARAIITTRFTAESVSDAIYAQVAGSSKREDIVTKVTKNFAQDPTAAESMTNNPLKGSGPDKYGNWFHLSDEGKLETCNGDLLKEPCFKAKVKSVDPLLSNYPVMELDIIARGACVSTGNDQGDVSKCIYRKFTQIIKPRSYIDYVSMTESELPDTTVITGSAIDKTTGQPFQVGYITSDVITKKNNSADTPGNTFTNDQKILYCGAPSGSNVTLESKDGTSKKPGIVSCDTTATFSLKQKNNKFLPQQIDNRGKTVTSNNVFKSLAGGSPNVGYYYVSSSYPGNVTKIEMKSDKMIVNGVDKSYPANGVIYVDGDLEIKGDYPRSLTVAVNGEVTISGDITANSKSWSDEQYANGSVLLGETDHVFGITTNKNIKLNCNLTGATCEPRHITGVLSAPNGTIYNDGWNTGTNTGPNPARFYLYGSMIAKNHPVLGAYSSTSTGKITKGWAKTLTYDSRLRDMQPPYFFRTTQATMVKSTLEVTGCTSATAGDGSC